MAAGPEGPLPGTVLNALVLAHGYSRNSDKISSNCLWPYDIGREPLGWSARDSDEPLRQFAQRRARVMRMTLKFGIGSHRWGCSYTPLSRPCCPLPHRPCHPPPLSPPTPPCPSCAHSGWALSPLSLSSCGALWRRHPLWRVAPPRRSPAAASGPLLWCGRGPRQWPWPPPMATLSAAA